MRRNYPLGLMQPLARDFIIRWRVRKKYPYSSYVDIADCIEILLGSTAHFKDTSFTGPLSFDHIVDLREIKLGFDGPQLIEILVWYIQDYVHDRVAKYQSLG